MQIPININFDFSAKAKADGAYTDPTVVHLPKIYQGAPYDQLVRIKNASTNVYRDFTGFTNAKMDVRLAHGGQVLFSLQEDNADFGFEVSGLRIKIPATATKNVQVPPPSVPGIAELKFVYDIFLFQGGVVVEKFCQGTGILVGAITRY